MNDGYSRCVGNRDLLTPVISVMTECREPPPPVRLRAYVQIFARIAIRRQLCRTTWPTWQRANIATDDSDGFWQGVKNSADGLPQRPITGWVVAHPIYDFVLPGSKSDITAFSLSESSRIRNSSRKLAIHAANAQTVTLVDTVQWFPLVWDCRHPKYHDGNTGQQQWAEPGTVVGLPYGSRDST